MDVLPRIIRGIKLDDPIDGRDVQTTGLLALHGCWLLHATAACGAGTVAAHRHVCAQEDRPLGVAELKERGCSFVLFLLAVQVKARDVDVVQQLAVVFDLRRERTHSWSRTDRTSSAQQDLANGPHRVAGRKEHDDFSFFQVLLQEGEEKQEPEVTLADHVALFQALHCGVLRLLLDPNVHGRLVQGQFREVLHFRGLRR